MAKPPCFLLQVLPTDFLMLGPFFVVLLDVLAIEILKNTLVTWTVTHVAGVGGGKGGRLASLPLRDACLVKIRCLMTNPSALPDMISYMIFKTRICDRSWR